MSPGRDRSCRLDTMRSLWSTPFLMGHLHPGRDQREQDCCTNWSARRQVHWKWTPLIPFYWGLAHNCQSKGSISLQISHWQILWVDYDLTTDNVRIAHNLRQNWFLVHQGWDLGSLICSVHTQEEAKCIVQYLTSFKVSAIFTYKSSILQHETEYIRLHQKNLIQRVVSIWDCMYIMRYIRSKALFMLYWAD